MPTQTDFAGDIDTDLVVDIDELGDLHTKKYKPQEQLITERGVRSGFYIRGTLGTVVHGYCGRDKTPASLIVFDFQFQSPPQLQSRKFDYARLEFTFKKHPEDEPADDPYIVSCVPRDPVTLGTSDEDVTTVNQLNFQPSVTASGVQVSLGSASHEKTTASKKHYSALIQGQLSNSGGPGREGPNRVIWHAAQNANQKDGIPPRMTVALLLNRLDGQFSCAYDIKTKVDFRRDLVESWEKLRGRTDPEDPITFDPTFKPQGILAKMTESEREKLEVYESESKLSELVKLQMATPWASKEKK